MMWMICSILFPYLWGCGLIKFEGSARIFFWRNEDIPNCAICRTKGTIWVLEIKTSYYFCTNDLVFTWQNFWLHVVGCVNGQITLHCSKPRLWFRLFHLQYVSVPSYLIICVTPATILIFSHRIQSAYSLDFGFLFRQFFLPWQLVLILNLLDII